MSFERRCSHYFWLEFVIKPIQGKSLPVCTIICDSVANLSLELVEKMGTVYESEHKMEVELHNEEGKDTLHLQYPPPFKGSCKVLFHQPFFCKGVPVQEQDG